MNKIIVILGMCGSGKSEFCDYITKKYDFKRIYFGEVTFDKLKESGLEVNPQNERMMREKLRKEGGMGVYATLNIPKIKEAIKSSDVLVESLYSWDELKILKENFSNITTIAIVVDKKIRYERLEKREYRPLTHEEAIIRDLTESENIKKCEPIANADYYIMNNGKLIEFYERCDEVLNEIYK
jgi:dephospho-CoA kinase